jgi:CRP/FNR family cyclic AMP-dependent transcriptional regulator
MQLSYRAAYGDAAKVTDVKPATDKRTILRKLFLFGKLGEQQIDRLSSCVVTRRLARNTTIFCRGDPGSSMFFIASGEVKITTQTVAGRDVIFNLLGEGDVFGEIALLDGCARTADAVAAKDCELLVIERRDFLSLLRDDPNLSLSIIELLCGRLRRTTDQAEALMFIGLSTRLAKALLQLSTGHHDAKEARLVITQHDLANIIGMSRESTNRQLRLWEDNKWVRLERGQIVITSPEALTRIADGECDTA